LLDATTNAEANTVTNIPTSDHGCNATENRFTITLTSLLPNVLAAMTMSNTQLQGVTISGGANSACSRREQRGAHHDELDH
jgi:hypothetical protein